MPGVAPTVTPSVSARFQCGEFADGRVVDDQVDQRRADAGSFNVRVVHAVSHQPTAVFGVGDHARRLDPVRDRALDCRTEVVRESVAGKRERQPLHDFMVMSQYGSVPARANALCWCGRRKG